MERISVVGRLLKSTAAIGLMLVFAQVGHATTVRDGLKLFKRYFGTIDIASKGLGVRGTGQVDASGQSWTKCQPSGGCTINVTVPPNADIIAAFLYWETLEKTGTPSSAVGYILDPN